MVLCTSNEIGNCANAKPERHSSICTTAHKPHTYWQLPLRTHQKQFSSCNKVSIPVIRLLWHATELTARRLLKIKSPLSPASSKERHDPFVPHPASMIALSNLFRRSHLFGQLQPQVVHLYCGTASVSLFQARHRACTHISNPTVPTCGILPDHTVNQTMPRAVCLFFFLFEFWKGSSRRPVAQEERSNRHQC